MARPTREPDCWSSKARGSGDGELTGFLFDPLWVDGKYGGALNFGAEPGAIVADMGDELPVGNEPRTIAAWINLEFPAQAFFASYGAGGGGKQFNIGVEDNSGIPNIRVRHGGGSMFFDGEVLEGEWNHIAAVVPDGAEVTGNLRMYLNGEEVFSDDPTDVTLATELSSFVMGGKWDVAENRAFEGIIDDVWIYDEALDQAAIVEIMIGQGEEGATLLQAGDANMDLVFDQLDLVQVQIAAKYLTGADATWGEGDWDGAPGGEPGRPPAGNGRFDQLDIIAALGAGKYLTGPYGAVQPGGEPLSTPTATRGGAIPPQVNWLAVPEPTSGWLLFSALACVLFTRRSHRGSRGRISGSG
jgi:hypothetical protein